MTRTPRRRAPAGFTLVELMVALGLSMILAIALLKMQSTLAAQRLRTSDISVRDGEVRAAMDLITRDASGAGYLFANSNFNCGALYAYDTAAPGNWFVHHDVDAVAGSNGAKMAFATNLTLNYPPSGTPSDVLVVTSTDSASSFNKSTAPLQASGDTASLPSTTGLLTLGSTGTGTLAVGDVAAVQLTDGASATSACLRVPVVNYAGGTLTTTPSVLMPANFNGFNAQLIAGGFAAGVTDGLLGASKTVDLGAPATPTATTTAFYVDNSGAFPILMRAQYSLLDDKPVLDAAGNAVVQQIAAGVVSLQARFLVGPLPGSYMTAAAVTTANKWDSVCSVRVAIVTRSLNDDPDPTYTWAGTSTTPGTATTVSPGAPFADVPVAATFAHRRFLLQQTEIATRNDLLKGRTC